MVFFFGGGRNFFYLALMNQQGGGGDRSTIPVPSRDGAEVMKWPKRMLPSRPHPYSLTEVVFEDYGNLFFVGGMADDWVTGS